MKKWKNVKFLLIPIITSAIIFSWFYQGKIISNTTEEELSIYHPQKTALNYASFWNPTSVGQTNPFSFVRFPVFYALGIFEKAGAPAFLIQALLFWTLMVIGASSMYLLLRKCFLIANTFSLMGGLFYLLNLYSMTQIWKRMLYHGMFAWAYLPLFIFLWIKWIESKQKRWLVLFLLTSVFFAYAFSQPAFIITIWTPAGIFVLSRIWQIKSQITKIIKLLLVAVTGITLWGLVNFWWLYPMFTLGSTWTETTGQTFESDLSSLHAVSKSFPVWEVLLLRQSWYFSPENEFGNFYHNPIIFFISILVLFFVLLAVFKLKRFTNRGFVLTLALVGLFISKGTSFPLGYTFFYLLFLGIPFSAAFRNSYEKFGIVWLLAYTVLFALGLSRFFSSLTTKKRIFVGGGLLFLILVLVFPFWSGGVFPQKHRVIVPQYYKEANNYLNQRSKDRLFHIPFALELENSSYSWGFVGGDPSPVLFDLESITKPRVPLYYKVAALLPNFIGDKNFPKILGWLGVGNVILHRDSIHPVVNIGETTKFIEGWEGLLDKKNIGELVIYSLDKELINPRIYTADSSVSVTSIEEGLAKMVSGEFDVKKEVFILGDNTDIPATLQNVGLFSFKKNSNDHYLAQVKNATTPFILVLNNTFDKLWQAKIDEKIINKHFIVNGFANGWLIQETGDYEVDIRLRVWPWD